MQGPAVLLMYLIISPLKDLIGFCLGHPFWDVALPEPPPSVIALQHAPVTVFIQLRQNSGEQERVTDGIHKPVIHPYRTQIEDKVGKQQHNTRVEKD